MVPLATIPTWLQHSFDITSQLNEWGTEKGCRTGAITENERGVAIYGENGYVFTGTIPESMKTAIKNCNNRSQHIVDLTVTDSGYWCVVWDRNNYDGNLPTEMSNMLRQYKRDGEKSIPYPSARTATSPSSPTSTIMLPTRPTMPT